MKTKTKNLVIFLILGLVFPLLLNSNFNLNSENNTSSINPKSLGAYIVSFIHIDGSIPNNWSWTAGNYSWCSGDGSWNNPYIIENAIIDGSGREFGILVENSKNDYFIIRNCTIYSTGFIWTDGAIQLDNVSIGNIINNNCSFNVGCGIILDTNCNNNTISGNTANDNGANTMGIYLNLSDNNTISGNTANDNSNSGIYIGNSDYNTLLGNTLKGNDYGVWMWNGDNNVITGNNANGNIIGLGYEIGQNNTVSGNTVNNNTFSGLYISNNCNNNTITGNTANDNDDTGIYFEYDCNNSTISGNTANNNSNYGIYFDSGCNNSMISGNVLSDNNYGMYLDSNCDNNTINENFFLKNGKHAIDNGIDNKWNSTTIGNYWDNHTGPDDELPYGIVDTQYNISGTSGGIDYLPIAEDGTPRITINSPSEGDAFSSGAPNFNVEITDDYLDTMWYTLDGGSNNYTFTENGVINQSAWDGKDDGAITLTFYARDIPGYIGSAGADIIKDTVTPTIIINSPADGERFGTNAPLFNITVNDDNLDLMWYSFDAGVHIYGITNNTVFNQTAWTELSEGDVTITFYARDLAGNEASESVIVTKSVPSGLDPGMIITIVIVSIVGGVAVISVVYIFMKKRTTPA